LSLVEGWLKGPRLAERILKSRTFQLEPLAVAYRKEDELGDGLIKMLHFYLQHSAAMFDAPPQMVDLVSFLGLDWV
jgi:hypothetical protein